MRLSRNQPHLLLNNSNQMMCAWIRDDVKLYEVSITEGCFPTESVSRVKRPDEAARSIPSHPTMLT